MVVSESVANAALSGSKSFKPPALPVVTDLKGEIQCQCHNIVTSPRRIYGHGDLAALLSPRLWLSLP